MAVLASAGEQRDILAEALRVAEGMNSDGEKANVLVHADAYWKDDEITRRAYFETARSIHSDGEKARVLTSLVGRSGLSDQTLIETVRSTTHMGSDGEKARVLVASPAAPPENQTSGMRLNPLRRRSIPTASTAG